jgi:hypothetical protein
LHCDSNVSKIVNAHDFPGFTFGARRCGEDKGCNHADDSQNNEHLDQGKCSISHIHFVDFDRQITQSFWKPPELSEFLPPIGKSH